MQVKGKHVDGTHIVYKVINDFDSRYYIGVRKTDDTVFDGYLGSGIHITNMVKRYGKEHFTRITLFKFDNSTDAYNKEKELLESCLQDANCVNIASGGQGGATFTGKTHTLEVRQFLSQNTKRIAQMRSAEEKAEISRKISASNRKRTSSTKGRIAIHNGVIQKMIIPEDFCIYEQQGFMKGSLKKWQK